MSRGTEIIVYATYKELILLPTQELDLLKSKIKQFDPIEQISYCSFWNMICQTTYINDLRNMLYSEFRGLPRINKIMNNKELILHRETLLFYLSQIIENNIEGNSRITGHNDFYKKEYVDFGRCLLLSNSVINNLKPEFFEREFIRNIPYNLPNTIYWIYYHRIIRYSFIYSELFKSLPKPKKNKIEAGLTKLEEYYNIKLSDIFYTAKTSFIWFLGLQENYRMGNTTPESNTPMFNPNKINSFYIQRGNFKEMDTLIKVIDFFSKDYCGFRNRFELESKQRDQIDNIVYKYIRCFYDYPVFKCSDEIYCIVDFKFFMERVCRGLSWLIKTVLKENGEVANTLFSHGIDEQNGYLIEFYFNDLMQKMFGADIKITSEIPNSPDAIIETVHDGVKTFVLIEFTTKQYRIASLYNRSAKCFFEDVDRILFKDDKKDMGKLRNLDKYVTNLELDADGEIIDIIPVLITESPMGDYDLLNRHKGFMDRQLRKNDLKGMLRWKPIILNLEDMEFFWGVHEQSTLTQEFLKEIKKWQITTDKGQYWYYFSNYSNKDNRIINVEYLKIFNHLNLTNKP